MIGQKFSRLTVVSHVPSRKGHKMVACVCDCGKLIRTRITALISQGTKSCGCLQKEKVSQVAATHGKSNTHTYRTWVSMLQRCNNPKNTYYHNYGGRGITVCVRWALSFASFLSDMGEKPNGYELDRTDNNGNYEPSNCRWVTRKENSRNRRTNKILTLNGESKCMAVWADDTGINRELIHSRVRRGWSVEKSLNTPKMDVSSAKYKTEDIIKIKIGMDFKTVNALTGMSMSQFYRIKRGDSWSQLQIT